MLELCVIRDRVPPYVAVTETGAYRFLVLKPDLAYCLDVNNGGRDYQYELRSSVRISELTALDTTSFTVTNVSCHKYPRLVHFGDPGRGFGIRFSNDCALVAVSGSSFKSRMIRIADPSDSECSHSLGTEATVELTLAAATFKLKVMDKADAYPKLGHYRGLVAIAFGPDLYFLPFTPDLVIANPVPSLFTEGGVEAQIAKFYNDGSPFSGSPKVLVNDSTPDTVLLQIGGTAYLTLNLRTPARIGYVNALPSLLTPVTGYKLAPAGTGVHLHVESDATNPVLAVMSRAQTCIAAESGAEGDAADPVVYKSVAKDLAMTRSGVVPVYADGKW